MVSRPVVIGSRYSEFLESQINQIEKNNEKPAPLSEIKSKLPSISKSFSCYCNRCGHETIKPNETVYYTPFGVIKASCIQIFWKNNLFKMHYNPKLYEGICNN